MNRLAQGTLLLAALLPAPALIFQGTEEGEEPEVALQIIAVSKRGLAETILKQLRAGEQFERLAAAHSQHPTASVGGYLGKVRLSGLRPEIKDAVKGVGPGQVTEVVGTPSGFMIVKVLSEAERVEVENAARAQKLSEVAAGKFQRVIEVSGDYWVERFFVSLPKPPGWNQDLQTICDLRGGAVASGIELMQSLLSAPKLENPERQSFGRPIEAHQVLAELFAYRGELAKAIEHFQSAYALAISEGDKATERDLEERIGIAYLHQSAMENSVADAHLQSCLFPIAPEARYKVGSSSENAIKFFSKRLERDPSDLEVKWLLNLAYMMLGKHPSGVPKGHLIPSDAFQSKENIGRFVDVAPSLGLNTFQNAGGAIMDDFDNDGFVDVVTSSSNNCDPMHYFRNNGGGAFTDQTSRAGLSSQLGGLNLIQADYNNDGCLDILVLRGAWTLPMRNSLLKNNCDGTFTDVTRESGLALPATATQTAVWADFDNDGYVDLFVGNELAPTQLFHNKGDGTFVDIAPAASADRNRYTKGVVAGDYDNDRYPDIYVSNIGENFLYHNNRDGTFTDVAQALQVEKPVLSFPTWFFDYDNDGWLDIFVAGYVPSVVEVVRSYLGLPVKAETLKLYRNAGGSFQDVTKDVGLDRVFNPMGANFGDIDNDGFLDFYLGTGGPSFGNLVPNALFRNHGGESFVEITTSSGTGCLHKGHGIAFGDINNDGDEDLLVEVGGHVPADKHATLLFRNPGNANNWISIRLVGVKTNRAAIGARIKLTLQTEDRRRREVHRVVGSGGSFGASPLQQHIGLGNAKRIESLEIWWPTSDTRQIFRNLGVNQFIEIKEFEKDFKKLNRRSFSLDVKTSPHLVAGKD